MLKKENLRPFLKPPTGIGRGKGRRKDSKVNTNTQRYGGVGNTIEPINTTLDVSRTDALQQLEAMAKRGEIPNEITGSKADRARFYEEFDRLFDEPPGEMGKYKTQPATSSSLERRLDVRFEESRFAGGKEPTVKLANYISQASQAEISGATKYAIYVQRPVLEQALMYRMSSWPTSDMLQKYGVSGTRIFNNTEKKRIEQEIKSHVEEAMKSPLSSSGQTYANAGWERKGDGWVRVDA